MRITGKADALPVPDKKQLAAQIEAMGLDSGGAKFKDIGPKKRDYWVEWTTNGDVINVSRLTPM
ncbi:MAG TPA: hypothetical protein VGI60_09480 [Chthoniobacterales bacterium]|jgi:hypothetical protein